MSPVQRRGFIASPKNSTNLETEAFRSEAKADFCGLTFSTQQILVDLFSLVKLFLVTLNIGLTMGLLSLMIIPVSIFVYFATMRDLFRFALVGTPVSPQFLVCFRCKFCRIRVPPIVSFSNAKFQGEVWFGATTFHNYSNFTRTAFMNDTSFRGIITSGIFDLTEVNFVNFVPDFYQSNFKEAPDLDNAEFPLPKFWLRERRQIIGRYRALRRLAISRARSRRISRRHSREKCEPGV